MSDDMRGLFFIVKGQYKRGVEPHFITTDGDKSYIGGYDPHREDTEEWYRLIDNRTFHCVACGRDLGRVLKGVYTTIKTYKGSVARYIKHLKGTSSSPPLSMVHLDEHIYEEYGDYLRDEIREMEDLAYSELVDERPINRTKKILKRSGGVTPIETTKKEEVEITPHMKKVNTKAKLGIKKLPMN